MQAIVAFILEVDRLKAVHRKNRPVGQDRPENSAEHSWQVALLALSLLPHAPQPLDGPRVVEMLLVHDLGEIDAGDVLVYADIDWAERQRAERAAVQRLAALLPAAQGDHLMGRWLEFDAGQTPEARFALAVDRAMPMLLNLAGGGHSWREHGVRHSQVVARNRAPIEAACPALWAHLEGELAAARDRGWFAPDDPGA